MRALRALILTIFIAGSAEGQRQQSLQSGRWEYVALPAINFNSDEGFGYGALVEAYRHAPGVLPYRFTVQPTVLFTTRGRRDFTVFFDAPALLPSGWRLDAFVGREQELAAPYYGVGNDAVHDTALSAEPNPYYYRYGRTRLRVLSNVQRRIGTSRARWLAGAGFASVTTDATPFDSGTTLLQQQLGTAAAPRGTLAYVRAGLVWDSRDREIGPTSGWWNEVLAQRVDRALGASHSYTRVTAAARRYTPITERLTLASRVIAQQTSGDVPLYDLATVQLSYRQEEGLGGNKMLRGIPKNRVMGKALVVANNELRWRAAHFSLLGKPSGLVLSGFADVGRVWADRLRPAELASDLWLGLGGGARLALGSSSVIAVDVGRSSEATQLYIGLGYAF
jgi:outer membrane translocation and assembly module TamA